MEGIIEFSKSFKIHAIDLLLSPAYIFEIIIIKCVVSQYLKMLHISQGIFMWNIKALALTD